MQRIPLLIVAEILAACEPDKRVRFASALVAASDVKPCWWRYAAAVDQCRKLEKTSARTRGDIAREVGRAFKLKPDYLIELWRGKPELTQIRAFEAECERLGLPTQFRVGAALKANALEPTPSKQPRDRGVKKCSTR